MWSRVSRVIEFQVDRSEHARTNAVGAGSDELDVPGHARLDSSHGRYAIGVVAPSSGQAPVAGPRSDPCSDRNDGPGAFVRWPSPRRPDGWL
jgi:hypothetical protein